MLLGISLKYCSLRFTLPFHVFLRLFCFLCIRCRRFKKRYAGEYEGMSTSELAGDLRRDVEHYRGLWRTARGADKKVKESDKTLA